MKYLLMIVLLCSFSQAMAAGEGGFFTGGVLLDLCEEDLGSLTADNAIGAGACYGYVLGIIDAGKTYATWALMKKYMCLPDGVEGKQLIRIVAKYLQEHPENLHLTAASLVTNALGLAFPCE